MKRFSAYIAASLLVLSFALPCFGTDSAAGGAKAKGASASDSKKQVYMGDPATKRGYELGYDDGVKAGKEDKKNGKKENPSGHENYKLGEKKFRAEYGNRGKFVGGYQGGFLKGYKSGYGREKTDPEAAKLSKQKEKEKPAEKASSAETKAKKAAAEAGPKEASKPPVAPVKAAPKPRAPSTADDAL